MHAPENIIKRVKKCLALAKSSNPNEAAIALHQAQILMRQYSIDEIGIYLNDIKESYQQLNSQKLPAWHCSLIGIVAEAFGCRCLIDKSSHFDAEWKSVTTVHLKFIGLAERCEVAGYVYTVLYRQILKARKDFISNLSKRYKRINKTLRADKYCEGFVAALYKKVSVMALNEKETQALTIYIEKHYPKTSAVVHARETDRYAKAKQRLPNDSTHGYQDGQQAYLHYGVSGSQQEKAALEKF